MLYIKVINAVCSYILNPHTVNQSSDTNSVVLEFWDCFDHDLFSLDTLANMKICCITR